MTTFGKQALTDQQFDELYDDYVKWLLDYQINIDATHRCMLACVFCSRTILSWGMEQVKDHQQTYGDLRMEDARLLGNSFKMLMFCGNISDPIYHPQFIEIVQEMGNTSVERLQIHTNGSHKSMDWWKKFVEVTNKQKYYTVMYFGIDGIDEKTALHRKNQKFQESWDAMIYCKENMDPAKSLIIWQFIPFKYNEHEIPQAKKLAQEHKLRFLIVKSGRFGYDNGPLDPPSDPNLYSTNIQSTRETIRYDQEET
tara:strand:+ start:9787 stop:10548 length:762 start_codon:yes stop_codon:yes gene_type:complete